MFGQIAILAAAATLLGQVAFAETFEVQMLNKGESRAMLFEPAFLNVALGDPVVFIPTDKGHNVESIKCTPHYTTGMVALIQVGNPIDLEDATGVKQKGKAKKRLPRLFEQISSGS